MNARDCQLFRETLLRVRHDAQTAIPDELALHLDACSACRRLFDATKVDLDADAFEIIPTGARQTIVDRLAAARRHRRRPWVAAGAAVFAVVVILGSLLLVERAPTTTDTALVTALVDDHIRYLDHPDRQAAADPETLTRYLDAYVDFPVELPTPPDVTFTGARRCMVLDRRATLAFYDTTAGPVSYFVLAEDGAALDAHPCPGAPELFCETRGGYHVVHWHRAGLLHALIGEKRGSLMSFAQACGASVSVDQPS